MQTKSCTIINPLELKANIYAEIVTDIELHHRYALTEN